MKKKSGHRRRTKVVRRSKKKLRRTVKRKSLGKGRRRPTRRYSRVQRGGGLGEHATNEERAGTSLPDCVTIDEFKNYYVSAVNTVYKDREKEAIYHNRDERKKEFNVWMKDTTKIVKKPEYTYSSTWEYPVSIVDDILEQILSTDKKLCKESIDIIRKKIIGYDFITKNLDLLTKRNEEPIQPHP